MPTRNYDPLADLLVAALSTDALLVLLWRIYGEQWMSGLERRSSPKAQAHEVVLLLQHTQVEVTSLLVELAGLAPGRREEILTAGEALGLGRQDLQEAIEAGATRSAAPVSAATTFTQSGAKRRAFLLAVPPLLFLLSLAVLGLWPRHQAQALLDATPSDAPCGALYKVAQDAFLLSPSVTAHHAVCEVLIGHCVPLFEQNRPNGERYPAEARRVCSR